MGQGVVGLVIGLASLIACSQAPTPAPIDQLLLPSGLAQSPDRRWLFVTHGNWDRQHSGSALVALDLAPIAAGIAGPRAAGAVLDRAHPCRRTADGQRIECDPSLVIEPLAGVRLPSGAGNIAVDRPFGEHGPLRLLIPTRLEPSLAWVDVFGEGFGAGPGAGLRFDCGQAEDRECDSDHRVEGIRGDPSRVTIDDHGFRYAYLPHLLGRSLTLFALDGVRGPAIADVAPEFFSRDELFMSGLGGGFAVIQRPCDEQADNAPADSQACSRPYLIASQRFWPGLRTFRVAPGLSVLLSGSEPRVLGPNVDAADPRPLMGGMAFEDPEQGDRLLVVHTTPSALSRLDTSLDDAGAPRFELATTVGVCPNPNLVAVHRPSVALEPGPDLAFVTCYGSDQLAVIDLGVFKVVRTLALGGGPNELLVDAERRWLFVANTAESSISIVDLDATRASYLDELASLGLDTHRP